MTKYVKTETKTVGSKKLTVMIRKGTSSAIADTAAETLDHARKLLEVANGVVYSSRIRSVETRRLLKTYFRIKDDLSNDQIMLIRRVITETKTGLAGDVVIKTGKILSGEKDTSTRGQVLRAPISEADYKSKTLTHADRTYQTFVQSLDPTESSKFFRRGAIHVTSSRLNSIYGVKTFIHEATHKYSGTIDYCYFSDDGATPRGSFTDSSQALINADSYAWFVFMVGSHMTAD